MFSLFKSKRNRWRDEAAKLFDVCITSLQGFDPSEIGALLDLAIQVRNKFIQSAAQNTDFYSLQALTDPVSVPEDKALTLLEVWHAAIARPKPETMPFVGALTLWWLSLAAGAFAELRVRGKEMWTELGRGFLCSESFNACQDVPRGLLFTPLEEIVETREDQTNVAHTPKEQFETGAITAEQYLRLLEVENVRLKNEIERSR